MNVPTTDHINPIPTFSHSLKFIEFAPYIANAAPVNPATNPWVSLVGIPNCIATNANTITDTMAETKTIIPPFVSFKFTIELIQSATDILIKLITTIPIKLKIALDNGEVLGMETTGYLNNHTERDIKSPKISKSQAKASLNKNLEIMSEGLAIIPTEWKTEIYCYEFKGKVDDTDFLVYVNSDTGKEENILVIIDTPNGILTQ